MLVARDPATAAPSAVAGGAAALGRLRRGGRRGSCCGADQQREPAADRRRSEAALAAYEKTAAALPLDPVTNADLPRVLPLLDQARALPHGVGCGNGARCTGCSSACRRCQARRRRARRLSARARARAAAAVDLAGSKRRCAAHFDQPAFLYEATRVYLMLGRPARSTAIWCKDWMRLDWQAACPGPALSRCAKPGTPSRTRCSDKPLPKRSRSTARWSRTRARPSAGCRWPTASIRGSIRGSSGASGAAVAAGRRARARPVCAFFVRALGQAADRWHSRLLHGRRVLQGPAAGAAGDVASEVASESWVLGKSAEVDPDQLRR